MQITIKNNKGITLIALVVTIIVLIILAVVSINLLFGQSGIIKRAEKAKDMQEKAQVVEEAELVKADWMMGQYEKNAPTRFQVASLVAKEAEHFNGTAMGNVVTTEDEKWDIIVSGNQGNYTTMVLKHGEASDKPYLVYYLDPDTETDGGVDIIVVPILYLGNYEEYAENKLSGKTDTEKETMFIESMKYFGEMPREAYGITSFKELMEFMFEYADMPLEEGETVPITLEEFLNYQNARLGGGSGYGGRWRWLWWPVAIIYHNIKALMIC